MDDLTEGVEAQGVGIGGGGVDPSAPNGSATLEDDDAVSLAAELTRGHETCGAGADDCHPAGGRGQGHEAGGGGGREGHERAAYQEGRRVVEPNYGLDAKKILVRTFVIVHIELINRSLNSKKCSFSILASDFRINDLD